MFAFKNIVQKIEPIVTDAFDLFFPRFCPACNKRLLAQERGACIVCWSKIEQTDFHFSPKDNIVYRKFEGKFPISGATACFYFDKDGALQSLIHSLKYERNPSVGRAAGRLFGYELAETDFAKDIDAIVPIPLHSRKLRERGYNQTEIIAKAMGQILNTPTRPRLLKRKRYTETQTQKNRMERWENVQEVFEAKNVEGLSLLLIDDVVTTGATLEAAARCLLQNGARELKIAALAAAR